MLRESAQILAVSLFALPRTLLQSSQLGTLPREKGGMAFPDLQPRLACLAGQEFVLNTIACVRSDILFTWNFTLDLAPKTQRQGKARQGTY